MAVGDGRRLQHRWRRGDGTTEAAQCARTCRPTVRRARQCRRLACGRHVREFARVAPRCRVGHIQRTSCHTVRHEHDIHTLGAQVASAFVRPSLSSARKRLLGRARARPLSLQHLSPHARRECTAARRADHTGSAVRTEFLSALFRPRPSSTKALAWGCSRSSSPPHPRSTRPA